MGIWVNFGLQFIRGKMGICRNGKLQNQISRTRTKRESNFGVWRKVQAKWVSVFGFWKQNTKMDRCHVVSCWEKTLPAGFRFRRKTNVDLLISERKETFYGMHQTEPNAAQTCCLGFKFESLNFLVLYFHETEAFLMLPLWKTCKIGNLHKIESLGCACKFFAVKWEFAKMGISTIPLKKPPLCSRCDTKGGFFLS